MNKHIIDQTGTKIRGFFGMFDILGYRDFIKQNALDKTIDIFKRLMVDLDRHAVTLAGQDTRQLTALTPTKSLVFSDTIILYQALSRSMIDFGPTFLAKACVLLRFAFERGLPLRGAISFGEFFVHERAFLGMPIIDAYEAEKKQQWSGVALTLSAQREYEAYETRRQSSRNVSYRGITWNPEASSAPFSPDIVVDTDIPIKNKGESKTRKGYSLRWDDFIVDYARLEGIKDLNASLSRQSIKERVEESFSAHGKQIKEEDVREKIERTVGFLVEMRDRPLKNVRLTYVT
jgi:hypothetical protein